MNGGEFVIVFGLLLAGCILVGGLILRVLDWAGLIDLHEYDAPPPDTGACTCRDGRPCPFVTSHPWRWSGRGQSTAEYGLILSLVAILCIVALLFLSGALTGILSTVGSSV